MRIIRTWRRQGQYTWSAAFPLDNAPAHKLAKEKLERSKGESHGIKKKAAWCHLFSNYLNRIHVSLLKDRQR